MRTTLTCDRPVHHVLAGSSLGPESDLVVRAALSIARAAGARLSLLYALEPPPAVVPTGLLGFALVREGLADAGREKLAAQLRRLGATVQETGELLVEAAPACRALQAAASRLSADLIVVGAGESLPLPLQRVGSTVRTLLREAVQPVLVIKRELRLPLVDVLAPLDLSLHSADSMRCGLSLLASCGSGDPLELVVLHVRSEGVSARDAERELAEFLVEHLSDYRGRAREVVRSGEAAPAILAYATSEQVELVLLGTHGRTGWRRWTLGSVAEVVVREAKASVLVVPPAAALAEAIAGAILEQTVGSRG
jgi:nucleotide-binding universal stress UspA family protein